MVKKTGASYVAKNQILSREEVLHVAKLAQLELTEEEVIRFRGQLSEVLEYVGQLQKVPTAGIPETSQVTGLEDVTAQSTSVSTVLSQQQAVANAPSSENGFVKVKNILKAK